MKGGPTCFVFKRRRRRKAGESPRRAKTWTARVGLAGEAPREYALKVTDERVANEKAREILRELEHERAGLLAPRPIRDAGERPIGDHVSDYLDDLTANGRDSEYVYILKMRLGKLIAACGWRYLRDVTADSMLRWRSSQGAVSCKTQRQYLATAKGLFSWLCKAGRWGANPLAAQTWDGTGGGDSFKRRALSMDEQQRLLAVAGPRRAVYLLALLTGLRRAEIDQLEWRDVEEGPRGPLVRVRGSTTKNGKSAVFPLRRDVWGLLSASRAASGGKGRVFPDGCPSMADMRADLAAAGIAEVTEAGRVDFHSLRHTMITNAKRAGVVGAVVTQFARHSDSRLTDGVYTDATQLPTWDVPDRLPWYGETVGGGTFGGTLGRDARGRAKSQRVGTGRPGSDSQVAVDVALSRVAAESGVSGRELSESSVSTTPANRFSVAVWANGPPPSR